MVSKMLTLLALVTTASPEPASGTRVEALAKAIIVRGVMLRPAITALPVPDAVAAREVSRSCDTPDTAPRRCRLIVVDLP